VFVRSGTLSFCRFWFLRSQSAKTRNIGNKKYLAAAGKKDSYGYQDTFEFRKG
jgi:hypothetical protein